MIDAGDGACHGGAAWLNGGGCDGQMPCGEKDEECETKIFHEDDGLRVCGRWRGVFLPGGGWGLCLRGGPGKRCAGDDEAGKMEGRRRLAAERHGLGAIHRRRMASWEERVSALSSTLQQGLARFQLYSRRPHRGLFTGNYTFAPWWGGPVCQHVLHGSGRDGRGHGEHVALCGTAEICYRLEGEDVVGLLGSGRLSKDQHEGGQGAVHMDGLRRGIALMGKHHAHLAFGGVADFDLMAAIEAGCEEG